MNWVIIMTENYDKNLEKQRKRLTNVFEYLKINGIKQNEICKNLNNIIDEKNIKLNVDETTLSHYKSGKIKYIPSKFLEVLHEAYEINPEYIRLMSSDMFDDKEQKYKHFEKLVDSWETVQSKDNKYLYLNMDRNFYDFLIEYDKYHKANEEGIPTGGIEELKAIYKGTPNIEEFVVLPRNVFFEIVGDTNKATKNLAEIIDFSEHIAILDEE